MSWIFLAFGSVIFFTTLNLLQRVLALDSKNPRAMAIVFNSIAALIALLIFTLTGAFRDFVIPSSPKAWIALLIASFCYAMFERGRFIAAKLLDASVLTTIMNIAVLVAFVGAIFFYSEPLTTNKLLGGALIIGALFLVSINNKTKKSSREGVIVAVVISIMLGLGWMLDKLGTQFFNASTYNIFVWTIPIIFIYFPHIKLQKIKMELKMASWKVFALAGLNVVGYLMQLKALETAEVTRVIPIVQTSTLFTILLGIILLKEREHIPRKIVAGLMAIAGAFFLI
ncbi:DMT family transporter [Patescibacteria group bacterium]|nr:DMT family transporter [Patescibacteria group bacterium]MBU1868261.1 DMT family transporter [Patescibacteria group bacterium]